jgi:phosphoglycerate dehydrogenase-like enzyme
MTTETIRLVVSGNLPSSFPTAAFGERIELTTAHTDEELRIAVREAEILYTWRVPEEVPAMTPGLRWIQLVSAGVDHIRGLPVWESGITVTAAQGMHTVPMAEHCMSLLLALTRQVPALIRAQDREEWIHNQRDLRFGELRGKTLGIVGWGKIGDGVAHLARAFGMRIVGTRWSVMIPSEVPRSGSFVYADEPWLERVDSPPDIVYPSVQLHEVLGQSDVVVLILPLTSETESSFGEPEFRAMKRRALFLNIGRGRVVREEDLVATLQSGHLAGAGIDVFAQEPLPRSSPLWSMPNVLISPHVGGVSDMTRDRVARLFAVNLTRYLEGQPLLNEVHRAAGY